MDQEEHEKIKKRMADLMHEDQKLNDAEYLTLIREQNNDNLVDFLGLQKTGKGYRFDFFNRPILFDYQDFIDLSGQELSLSIKIVLCKYLLNCPHSSLKKSVRLVTFREFSEAGPLFYRFAENTSKTIEQTAVFLFHEDAVNYLDLKSLGSITTYLTGHLITAL